MKHKNALALLAGLLFAAVALSAAPTAQAGQCSLAVVAGKWGFTTSGTVVGIGPRASVGILTLDAAGNLLGGKATANLNGSVTHETFSGTYSVNPDCTGKSTIDVLDLSGNPILTITFEFVVDDNLQGLRSIFTSAVLPNGTPLATVITSDAKRVSGVEESN